MKRRVPFVRRKAFLIPAAFALLLLLAAGLLYGFGIDLYCRRYVEKLAEGALRVPVHIERAEISIHGRSALHGISIVNPPGYREPEAFLADHLDGYLEAHSVFEPTIRMRDLVLVHPVFTLDFLDGRSNFGVLIANLSGDPVDPDAVPPEIPGQKFRISRLRVIDGSVRFRSDAAKGGFIDVVLPELELHDFGDAPGSEPSLQKILALVFEAMAGSALKAENPGIPADLRRGFVEELRKLVKKPPR